MIKALLVVALLAGTAHAGPPPLFAKLFQAHTWTFKGETIDQMGPDRDVTKGEVTCEVSDVKTLKHGWSAELFCSGMTNANLANGTYVATDAGLWRVDDPTDKLDKARMLIGATPKAGKRTLGDETIMVKRHEGAWCFADMTEGGDEGGWMLCIDAKHGLVGGNGFFAGGATHDTYFGKTPRY